MTDVIEEDSSLFEELVPPSSWTWHGVSGLRDGDVSHIRGTHAAAVRAPGSAGRGRVKGSGGGSKPLLKGRGRLGAAFKGSGLARSRF